MRKLKAKIGTFFFATALIGGSLLGCTPKEPPAPTTYLVTVNNQDSKFTVAGLRDDKKYAAGETVDFTVTVNDAAYELKSVEVNEEPITAGANNHYTFEMPAKPAEIDVTLRKKDVWEIAFTPALKVTFTSEVAVKLNDQTQVATSYTLESSDPTKAEVVDSTHILGKDEGDVTISVKVGTTTVLSQATTVKALEKGDTQDNPLSTTEAYEKAKALGSGKKSESKVYIKGVVKSLIEKYDAVGDNPAYASYWLDGGGSKDFEVYKANFTGTTEENFDIGSEVIVYDFLKNFNNSTMETNGGGDLLAVSNTNPYAIVSEKSTLILKPAATGNFGFRIAPKGSSTATITYKSASTEIATVAADGTVTAAALGNTKITAEAEVAAEKKLSKEVTVIVSNSTNDGSEEHPFTTDEAINLTLSLKDQEYTEDRFYYQGVVSKITAEYSTQYKNMTFNLAGTDAEFVCYRVGAADHHDNVVKGALVTCYSQLQNYGGVAESKSGSVTAADKSKVRYIEVAPDELQISLQETTHTTLAVTTYPEGIDEAVSFGILGGEDPNVVSVSDGGLVTPLKTGNTIIRVSCQDGVALVPVEVVDGEVVDKWAAQDTSFDPLYDASTAPYPTTENVPTENEYYVVGKLGALSVAAGHVFTSLTTKDGKTTVDLVDLFDSTGRVKYPDMTDNEPKEGDIVIVKGQLELYKKSGGSDPAKNEVLNAKLVQLNGVVCVPPELSGLVIDHDTLSLGVNEETSIEVFPDPIDAAFDASKVQWASSSANVTVTPDETNKAKATVKGVALTESAATITASYTGLSSVTCSVSVIQSTSKKYENIGEATGVPSSGTATITEFTLDGTTFGVKNGKKQGSAIILYEQDGAFLVNVSPMSKDIKSVTLFINSGAAAAATYGVAFSATAFTARVAASEYVNITGGNSHKFACGVSGAKYFCISLGTSKKNGQVLSIEVEFVG